MKSDRFRIQNGMSWKVKKKKNFKTITLLVYKCENTEPKQEHRIIATLNIPLSSEVKLTDLTDKQTQHICKLNYHVENYCVL